MKDHEFREFDRYQLVHDISFVYEGAPERIPVRPPDLSVRGMFIHTNRIFPEGSILKVSFRLARSGVEVRVRAEVRHCEPGSGVGVEFIDLAPDAREAIERELATHNGEMQDDASAS